MAHEIDLSKYEVRTDLLIESFNDSRLGKIDTKTRNIDDICVTEIIISDDNSKYCNKKPGKYITITFEDVTDSTNQDKVEKVFTKIRIISSLITYCIPHFQKCHRKRLNSISF